ncbi:hypothetical protein AVEN_129872-1 [Araneus ventricosus]|uniref:Uncharacterized protein n=1 Tax=Araneus ventricosus TaxID=182803 RepID=A0A4Y2TGM3_ARAVE|nr:hypothetical protein AVEN_90529-1 [Araneus ventricosus]GBO16669.1 hypothetical protein AVEN_129872-1 [Araneus ventricosus]
MNSTSETQQNFLRTIPAAKLNNSELFPSNVQLYNRSTAAFFFRKRTNELTAVFTTEHCACHLLSDRTDAAGGAGQLCDGHARHPADACRIGSGKREECVCHRLFHRSHYGQGRTGCQRQIKPGR